jgi:hypothetical protein
MLARVFGNVQVQKNQLQIWDVEEFQLWEVAKRIGSLDIKRE